MHILIIYFSNTGNTKRVVELVGEKLHPLGDILIKNALTASPVNVEWADLIIIGSPIHGYILFGQKFCSQVLKFITKILPDDLHQKKVLLFATFLFSPGKAFKKVEKVITSKNGLVTGKYGKKRSEKVQLSDLIYQGVTEISLTPQ